MEGRPVGKQWHQFQSEVMVWNSAGTLGLGEWLMSPGKSLQALAREKEPREKLREDSKICILGDWEIEQ